MRLGDVAPARDPIPECPETEHDFIEERFWGALTGNLVCRTCKVLRFAGVQSLDETLDATES